MMEKTKNTDKISLQNNRYAPLVNASGFEKVELLPDGRVRFTRRYFWRIADCTMNAEGEVVQFEAHMNWVNCLIAIFLGFFSLILVILIGINTKENLKKEVLRIMQDASPQKAARIEVIKPHELLFGCVILVIGVAILSSFLPPTAVGVFSILIMAAIIWMAKSWKSEKIEE